MQVELSKQEKELLTHAGDRCGCESYYRYTCEKCRQTGKGFVTSREEAYRSLIDAGLVYHNSYHNLRPTYAGAQLCEKVGIKVWSCHSGRGVEREKP